MPHTKLCPDKACRFPGCRRIAHYGRRASVRCPECGAVFELAEIGNVPIPAMGQHPPRDGKHSDWRHATGVSCAKCNHYFVAEGTHDDLLDTMEDWERPVESRAEPDFPALVSRLRERMKHWRGGGARSQYA